MTAPIGVRCRRPALAILAVALLLPGVPARAATPIEGILSISWGDPPPDEDGTARLAFHLAEDDGAVTRLGIDAALLEVLGGPLGLNGRRVEAVLSDAAPEPRGAGESAVPVVSLRLLDGGSGPDGGAPPSLDVTGSKPWISILCKFDDISAEPEDLAFFQGMYGSAPGQLDHYWREVSYEAIDVVGSLAVDWVELPHSQGHYVPTPGSGSDADLTALFDDCTAAADAAGVDFSNGGTGGYEGINMMFNGLLDCCAWGGGRWAMLDGVTKLWRTTWEPPWAYAEEGVIAHEMGHGFGLPHSNNSDGDGSPYDSPWDVMSAATSYAVDDPTYGRLGKHTIGYHKDLLGWIPDAQRFDVELPGVHPLTLDHLAVAATGNFRLATIPIGTSNRYYAVEAREQVGGYDGMLPGNAVLIFEVDPFRTEPAWVLDADDPPATFSDNEGTMWKPGEVFEDAVHQVQVEVVGTAPDGFEVIISYRIPPVLATEPLELDLGSVDLGETSSAVLSIVNDSAGPQTLLVSSMVLSDTDDFSVDPGGGGAPCGTTAPVLPEGASCTVSVVFAPQVEASFDEELAIASNASEEPWLVPIAAEGLPCPHVEDLVLPEETVDDTRLEEACSSLTAGPYEIVAPGDVTLRAGELVTLRDGFVVGSAARLAVELF